jgi:hypothetical protein
VGGFRPGLIPLHDQSLRGPPMAVRTTRVRDLSDMVHDDDTFAHLLRVFLCHCSKDKPAVPSPSLAVAAARRETIWAAEACHESGERPHVATAQSSASIRPQPRPQSGGFPRLQPPGHDPQHRMRSGCRGSQDAAPGLIANVQFLHQVLPFKVQLAPRDGN